MAKRSVHCQGPPHCPTSWYNIASCAMNVNARKFVLTYCSRFHRMPWPKAPFGSVPQSTIELCEPKRRSTSWPKAICAIDRIFARCRGPQMCSSGSYFYQMTQPKVSSRFAMEMIAHRIANKIGPAREVVRPGRNFGTNRPQDPAVGPLLILLVWRVNGRPP